VPGRVRAPLPGLASFLAGQCELERQFVTPASQPGYGPDGQIRKKRALSKGFAGVDVRKMHFDERYRGGRQSVPQRYASVRKAARIDDDPRSSPNFGLVYPVDQSPFVVALEAVDAYARPVGEGL
jgi:hypothetical protein